MGALALAGTILTFVAIVAVGVLLRATGVVHGGDSRPLNAVIIYVGLPAFIFKAVHGTQLSLTLAGMVAVSWLVCAAMLLLGWLAARALGLRGPAAGAFILATAWGNTGFIGYPVTQALFGASAIPSVVFSDVIGTVFSVMTVGLLIAQRYGVAEDSPKANPLRELVTFPAVIAFAAGLALRPLTLPAPVNAGIGLLAAMVAPLIMLSVGISLRPRAVAGYARSLGMLSVLRLLVAPLIGLAVGLAILGHGVPLRAAVLEAGMPSMMLTLVIGGRFELDTELLAAAIFATTALSAITIPLVQLLAFR